MKRKTFLSLPSIVLATCFFAAAPVLAAKPTHLDTNKSPRGCSACHNAHGKPETPMMRDQADRLCLICHGPYRVTSEDQARDVYAGFQKRSKHPVLETARYHRLDEVLPETNPGAPRHVSCYDCHEPHTVSSDKATGRAMGITFAGARRVAEKDAEVCYKCHLEGANRPQGAANNLKFQFQPANQSYHPIERAARGKSVSLFKNIQPGTLISCSDCHEPHGSDYTPLLKRNYTMTDGIESNYAYDLCYNCHRRESILANESFTGSDAKSYGHREHVVVQRTACHTCHSAHGSQGNTALVDFDRNVVTGPGQYIPGMKGSASCILTCHGKEHTVAQQDKTGQQPASLRIRAR